MRKLVLAALTAFVAFTPVAAMAGALFSDTDFNLANYSSTLYYGTTAPSITFSQTNSGNPGTAYQAFFTYGPAPDGFDVLTAAFNNTFTYNPGVSGAITSIDVSLDRYNFPVRDGVPTGVGSYTLRPLILQGGNIYEANIALFGTDAGGIWHTLAQGGLAASDFGLFDASNLNFIDFSSNPDFTGGAMTFGFAMRSGGSGGAILQSATGDLRADNFFLTVNNQVPEPSTWALFFLGLGILAAFQRLRPRGRKA